MSDANNTLEISRRDVQPFKDGWRWVITSITGTQFISAKLFRTERECQETLDRVFLMTKDQIWALSGIIRLVVLR